jgi:hypothetical protein
MLHANIIMILMAVLIIGPVIFFILRAHRGQSIYIRPIAGLDAVDEAIGRATEMGRPIFYTTGLSGLGIEGLCSLAILKRVASLAAKYDLRVICTVSDYILYPMVEEMMRSAYAEQGKSDLFNADDCVLIMGQFPFAFGSIGLMSREKVSATFLFGSFAAESLILAEGGNTVGAIQVAGTPTVEQIPFFIVACDYTIIGEEYYAASAYLSHDPTMTGSLRGQDLGKFVIFALIIAGTVEATIGQLTGTGYFWLFEIMKGG